MKFKPEFSSIVIAGSWNFGIFNNIDWVIRYLFPGEKVTTDFSITQGQSIRYNTNDFTLYLLGTSLNFYTLNTKDTTYNKIEELAIKIADYLPHTPTIAFGLNYILELEENEKIDFELPYNDLLNEKFKLSKSERIIRVYAEKDYTLTLNLSKEGGKCYFDFNFNFNIASVIQIKDYLMGETLIEYKIKTLAYMSEIFKLYINE